MAKCDILANILWFIQKNTSYMKEYCYNLIRILIIIIVTMHYSVSFCQDEVEYVDEANTSLLLQGGATFGIINYPKDHFNSTFKGGYLRLSGEDLDNSALKINLELMLGITPRKNDSWFFKWEFGTRWKFAFIRQWEHTNVC